MRRGNLLLLVLAIFAAGGLGYQAGRRSVPDSPPTTGGAASEATPADDEPAPPPPETPSLSDVLARIPIPEWEPGDGVIKGTVRKDTGGPLAGVLVVVTAIKASGGQSRPGRPEPERSLETVVREAVLDHHWRRATRTTTTTGPDGSYCLEGLKHAYYSVSAHSRGFQIRPMGGAGRCWPGETVDLVAHARSLLTLTVLDPNGREVGEARIECTQPGGGKHSSTWASSTRTIQLGPGRYDVVALANSGEWKSEPVEVDLTGVGREAELTLPLRPVPGLRIRLVRPDDEPPGFCSLRALRVKPAETPDRRELLTSGLPCDHWTRSGDVFLFPDLTPGEWYVGALSDNALLASVRVTVTDGMVDADLVLPMPDPAEHLVVSVVGPDGEPVTDVSVSTGFRHKHGSNSGGGGVVPIDEGRYRVRHREVDENREYEEFQRFVTVRSRSLGSKEVLYDAETDREITVRFEGAAYVTVTVAGYAGSGYEKRLRVAVFSSSDSRAVRSMQTANSPALSSEGRRRFGPVTAGEYRVQLHLIFGTHESFLIQELDVTLESGGNDVAVPIPKLYPLTVIADSIEDGARGRLREIAPRPRWRLPGALAKDGRLSWPDLPAGEYEVTVHGKAVQGRMKVKVPDQREVRFVKEEK